MFNQFRCSSFNFDGLTKLLGGNLVAEMFLAAEVALKSYFPFMTTADVKLDGKRLCLDMVREELIFGDQVKV